MQHTPNADLSGPTPSRPRDDGRVVATLVLAARERADDGQLEDAALQVEAALSIDPEHAEARELSALVRHARVADRLARASRRLLDGDRDGARAEVEGAHRIDPASDDVALWRERLATRRADPERPPSVGFSSGRRAVVGSIAGAVVPIATAATLWSSPNADLRRAVAPIAATARFDSLTVDRSLDPGLERFDPPPAPVAGSAPPSRSADDTANREATEPTPRRADAEALIERARQLLNIGRTEDALAAAVDATELLPDATEELRRHLLTTTRESATAARAEAVRFGANEATTRYFRDGDELYVLGDFRAEESFAVATRSYLVAAQLFDRSRREALLDGVHRVLEAYEIAHESSDVEKLRSIWPALDPETSRRIESEFRRARSIAMRVDNCDVQLTGTSARATCQVQRTDERRFGRTRSQATETALDLVWRGDRWVIRDVDEPRAG